MYSTIHLKLSKAVLTVSRLMKKDASFVWDDACHNVFESINKYLLSTPLLWAPIPSKSFYYLRWTLTGLELNYTPIEKTCFALVFYIQKLRQYMQAYTIHLSARANPVRYVIWKPILTGCFAKWWLQISDQPTLDALLG